MAWTPANVLPGQLLYPLPEAPPDGILQRSVEVIHGQMLARTRTFRARRLWTEAAAVYRAVSEAAGVPADERQRRVDALCPALRREGMDGEAARSLLGIVAVAAGECWERPVGVGDLAAAMSLLRGQVVETGTEADMIAAVALAAAVAGHVGGGVHVICADAARLATVSTRLALLCVPLGLSSGTLEPRQPVVIRRQVYRADITCGVAGEFVNDTLRDARLLADRPGDLRLRLERLRASEPRTERLLQRGLVFGIVLDAEELMLDRALKTSALSDEPGAGEELKATALAYDVAGHLTEGLDYNADRQGIPRLTDAGRERITDMLGQRGGPWAAAEWRSKLVGLAILARIFLEPGLHYHTHPTGVEIVESSMTPFVSGPYELRLTAAMLTLRHGLPMPSSGIPVVTMSLMEFLLRYRQCSGIAGRLGRASAGEFWSLYGVPATSLAAGGRSNSSPALFHLGRDRSSAWERLAGALQSARQNHQQTWILADAESAAASIKEFLADRGFAVSGPGETGAAGHARAPDVTVSVATEAGPSAPAVSEVGMPAHALLLQLPRNASQAAVYRRWLGQCPDFPRTHLVLALDDPRLQRGLARSFAAVALPLADSLPWLSRQLAALCVWWVTRDDASRARMARTEHRKIAGRIQKLLAFSGSVIR